MSQTLTPQQIADLRLAGWHAAENGEADDPANPQEWRDGWHLRRYGVLPSRGCGSAPEARTRDHPVATLRRLILASVDGVRRGSPGGAGWSAPEAQRSAGAGGQPKRLVSVLQ